MTAAGWAPEPEDRSALAIKAIRTVTSRAADRLLEDTLVRRAFLVCPPLLVSTKEDKIRLKKLQRRPRPTNIDLLVRGEPQLTLRNITTIEDVDAYFEKKKETLGEA